MGLQQSGAVAHSWGLTINDTTAALMEMAQAGVVGSDAGTSLKTMLSRLLPTTKPAAEAMKELGIRTFDAHGNFVGMDSIIGQYHGALDKLNPAQRKAALQTIFGRTRSAPRTSSSARASARSTGTGRQLTSRGRRLSSRRRR
jgi:TP901 family phage tail tape measure protein